MPPFRIASDFQPAGDQPEAIRQLTEGVEAGEESLTLLGVTGTGKTFTIARVVEAIQRPTLVIAHNKTLGAQLADEFREFFPDNAVEYFVSYYDYYQPEAYIPRTDTYIEKDSQINDEIDRLRHAATAALLTRRDVVIVATVSCIYGLGSPEEYKPGPSPLRRDRGSRASSRCCGWSTSTTSGTTSASGAGSSASGGHARGLPAVRQTGIRVRSSGATRSSEWSRSTR